MEIPTHKEFEELITFCNQNRFPNSIDIWPSQAKEHVKEVLTKFMKNRESALEEMKALPAYRWLNMENGYLFSTAMNILFSERMSDSKSWIEEQTNSITYRTDATINELYGSSSIDYSDADISFNRLKESLGNITEHECRRVQRYEFVTADVARCFMNFIYPDPTKNIDIKDFKKTTKDIIKKLEEAQRLETNIEKYSDLMYLSRTKDGYLQNKIHFYKRLISDKKLLPGMKQTKKTPLRIFIISLTRVLIYHTRPLIHGRMKNREEDIQNSILYLMGITDLCLGQSMEKQNCKNIVSEEICRQNAIGAIRDEIFGKNTKPQQIR